MKADHHGREIVRAPDKSFLQHARRVALLFFIMPIAVILIGGALLLYIFQGQEINNAAIDTRVQDALDSLLGDEYSVSIGSTGLSFISSSALTLTGSEVRIIRLKDDSEIAVLNDVAVGLDFISLLQGNPKFDRLTIKGGRIEIPEIADQTESAQKLTNQLRQLAKTLTSAEQTFLDGKIHSVRISDMTIASVNFGRLEPGPVELKEGIIVLAADQDLNLTADLVSAKSEIQVSAKWRTNSGGGKQLSLGVGGINAAEWFETAEISDQLENGFGLTADIRVDGRIPFDDAGNPLPQFAKIQTANGMLRLGDKSSTEIKSASLSLNLTPETGEVELEPSEIRIGNRILSIFGRGQPVDETLGLQGPLGFHLEASSNLTDPVAEQKALVSGLFEPANKKLTLDNLIVDNNGEKITGYLGISFGEGSASLVGQLTSPQLSLPAIHASWPFHIAPKLAAWTSKNISAGNLKNIEMEFDVPQGRFDEVKPGGDGFPQGELSITADYSNVTIRTPQELPPVSAANGKFKFDGKAFNTVLEIGSMNVGQVGTAKISEGDISIPNVYTKGIPALLKAKLAGDMQTLATIGDRKPLAILKNIAVKPAELTGNAEVAINIDLDFEKTATPRPLNWKAQADLKKVGSKSPLFGRAISNADLQIEAENQIIKAKGSATIDGFNAKLDIVEPINGGASKLRQRIVTTRVTHQELAKLGIDISTVVKGNLDVEIKDSADGSPNYNIDLTNADISLPWISWLKGTGIAAKAAFALEQKDGVNTLSNFKFSGGNGLNAEGNLVFDKAGLVSTNLKNIKLRGADSFNVDVSRKGDRYVIAAQGAAFEGRALIDQIIHKDGLGTGKATKDVTLTANFGQLIGFEQKVMENALVNYETNKGLLTKLVVRGALNGKLSQIDASRSGARTTFSFLANDAGASLAMVNIYTKMRGGKLTSVLVRDGDGPFNGKVTLNSFTVIGEERLRSLVAAPAPDRQLQNASGKLQELNVQEVFFENMQSTITKGPSYLGVKNGRIYNTQIGLTFDGVLYDPSHSMNIRGTFMPLFSVSRLIGGIPIIGDLLSNGKSSGLIGITYRLKGAANNPNIAVNPISILAPGVFKEIFNFQQ
ncbi:MAG: DUF3971 domain-containing protein [Salaquimonas sp.]